MARDISSHFWVGIGEGRVCQLPVTETRKVRAPRKDTNPATSNCIQDPSPKTSHPAAQVGRVDETGSPPRLEQIESIAPDSSRILAGWAPRPPLGSLVLGMIFTGSSRGSHFPVPPVRGSGSQGSWNSTLTPGQEAELILLWRSRIGLSRTGRKRETDRPRPGQREH